jgi:hypothetical protein
MRDGYSETPDNGRNASSAGSPAALRPVRTNAKKSLASARISPGARPDAASTIKSALAMLIAQPRASKPIFPTLPSSS